MCGFLKSSVRHILIRDNPFSGIFRDFGMFHAKKCCLPPSWRALKGGRQQIVSPKITTQRDASPRPRVRRGSLHPLELPHRRPLDLLLHQREGGEDVRELLPGQTVEVRHAMNGEANVSMYRFSPAFIPWRPLHPITPHVRDNSGRFL